MSFEHVVSPSFIVFKDGSQYLARNGITGAISYSGTDASTVIQAVIDALTTDGIVFLKDAGTTIVLSDEIVVNAKRVRFVSNFAKFQPPNGKYCFKFINSHTWSSGNPNSSLENVYMLGSAKNGHGVLLDSED